MTKAHRQPPKRQPAKPKTLGRTLLATGAAAIGLGGALLTLFLSTKKSAPEGHAVPDLAPDKPHPGPTDRAPEHFRPDPTAVPTREEREALRPATGAASFPDRHVNDAATRNTPVG
jgi:hypothetical protein